MPVSSHSLATALAQRLANVIPRPLEARAESNGVAVYADGQLLVKSLATQMIDATDDRTQAERLETAAVSVLSGIQDAAMDYLGEMWPLEASGALALPSARVASGRLFLWYGSNQNRPAIELKPIEV